MTPLGRFNRAILICSKFAVALHRSFAMAENTAFSAAGEDVITRKIEIEKENLADKLSPEEFEEHYDIERTTKEIIEGDYKRVS